MYLLRSPQRPLLWVRSTRVSRRISALACCTDSRHQYAAVLATASTMALVKVGAMIRSPMAWGIGPAMTDAEQRGGLFVCKLRRAFCVRVGEQLLSDGQLREVAYRLPSGPGRCSSCSPGASCRARGLLVLAVRVVGQVLDNGVHQVRASPRRTCLLRLRQACSHGGAFLRMREFAVRVEPPGRPPEACACISARACAWLRIVPRAGRFARGRAVSLALRRARCAPGRAAARRSPRAAPCPCRGSQARRRRCRPRSRRGSPTFSTADR